MTGSYQFLRTGHIGQVLHQFVTSININILLEWLWKCYFKKKSNWENWLNKTFATVLLAYSVQSSNMLEVCTNTWQKPSRGLWTEGPLSPKCLIDPQYLQKLGNCYKNCLLTSANHKRNARIKCLECFRNQFKLGESVLLLKHLFKIYEFTCTDSDTLWHHWLLMSNSLPRLIFPLTSPLSCFLPFITVFCSLPSNSKA